MKLKVLGAAGTVTGSSYVLTSQNGQSILIDLGMFQGPQEVEALNYLPYEYDCTQLSGALLTHAHLDHCGRLPILFKLGFTEKILMTPATLDLIELSLYDSAKIAKFNPDKAMYNKKDVEKTLDNCRTIKYRNTTRLGDFDITFRDAGHLLGAASIEIEDIHNTSEIRKIVFSGDLGNTPGPLLQETEHIDAADAVVIESTYGDRLHPGGDPSTAFQEEINIVEKSNGTLLIPSFSMEKTQEILHIIKHLKANNKVSKKTPVFLDSPMAQRATDIYRRHPGLFNKHLRSEFGTGGPFDFPGFVSVMSSDESKEIHDRGGAKVILAGGGMMTGGRILSHSAHYLPDPKNRIFFTGYQGEETLGREIFEGATEVTIDETLVQIKATVSSTKTMSGHGDQNQLMDWLKSISGVKKVFVTHGEEGPREALAERIRKDLNIIDIVLPKRNEEVEF